MGLVLGFEIGLTKPPSCQRDELGVEVMKKDGKDEEKDTAAAEVLVTAAAEASTAMIEIMLIVAQGVVSAAAAADSAAVSALTADQPANSVSVWKATARSIAALERLTVLD